jgi:oligopeptide/dipeptide ABC transporter ATP-binding protein
MFEWGLGFDLARPRGPVTVVGDRDQLQGALGNLLDNGIKFTPEGGAVSLGLQRDGGWASLCVPGPGQVPWLIFVTRDLSLGHYISERAEILYRGSVVEMGATEKAFDKPLRPYTRMLVARVPRLDEKREKVRIELGAEKSGSTSGCVRYERCQAAGRSEDCARQTSTNRSRNRPLGGVWQAVGTTGHQIAHSPFDEAKSIWAIRRGPRLQLW